MPTTTRHLLSRSSFTPRTLRSYMRLAAPGHRISTLPSSTLPATTSPLLARQRGFSSRQPVEPVWVSEALLPWLLDPFLIRALLHGFYWWLTTYASWRLPRPVSLAQRPGSSNHRRLLPSHGGWILQSPLYFGLCISLPPLSSDSGSECLGLFDLWSIAGDRNTCPSAQTRPGEPGVPKTTWPPCSSA